MRRFETISLHSLFQGFSILDCEWLAPSSFSKKKKSRSVTTSEMEKRKEILGEFLYWFFDSYVTELVRVSSLLPFLLLSGMRCWRLRCSSRRRSMWLIQRLIRIDHSTLDKMIGMRLLFRYSNHSERQSLNVYPTYVLSIPLSTGWETDGGEGM